MHCFLKNQLFCAQTLFIQMPPITITRLVSFNLPLYIAHLFYLTLYFCSTLTSDFQSSENSGQKKLIGLLSWTYIAGLWLGNGSVLATRLCMFVMDEDNGFIWTADCWSNYTLHPNWNLFCSIYKHVIKSPWNQAFYTF